MLDNLEVGETVCLGRLFERSALRFRDVWDPGEGFDSGVLLPLLAGELLELFSSNLVVSGIQPPNRPKSF
jgi:hypothetical protein